MLSLWLHSAFGRALARSTVSEANVLAINKCLYASYHRTSGPIRTRVHYESWETQPSSNSSAGEQDDKVSDVGAEQRRSCVESDEANDAPFPDASTSLQTGPQQITSKPLSRRKLKAQRPSPSHWLISALEATAQFQSVPPKFNGKADLSYIAPWKLGAKQRGKSPLSHLPSSHHLSTCAHSDHILSFQFIVADYIRQIWPIIQYYDPISLDESLQAHLDRAIFNVYNEKSIKFLELRGYGPEDIVKWAWILTAPDTERAAWRLMMIATPRFNREGPQHKNVPSFLLLFLLRRANINGRTLKILLSHAWDQLLGRRPHFRNRRSPAAARRENLVKGDGGTARRWNTSDALSRMPSQMDESTMMTLVVRLLRHARQVWPASIPSITSMLSLHGKKEADHGFEPNARTSLKSPVVSRLTFLYNRALTLLSVPSSQSPFLSLPYHQRAQFNLLKKMAHFNPPLIINREGYRAVTRVQLAHKKTLRERAWAAMKAKSWPPWKEDKLGIDADKGFEDGISRATESMLRLKEAGYAHTNWELSANILAGWDTDQSPTIQTRALVRRASGGQGVVPPSQAEQSHDIWAARIRATRTVEEAWAGFLAFKDQKLRPSSEIYLAMFEKLVFDKKRIKEEERKLRDLESGRITEEQAFDEDDDLLPGDSKRVYPAPISPREAVHIPSPLLPLDTLFDEMVREGCTPSPRCLSFLLLHANSLDAGLTYFRLSGLPPSVLASVFQPPETLLASASEQLRAIPENVFSSLINLFCRFAPYSTIDIRQEHALIEHGADKRRPYNRVKPLLHAFSLVTARGSSYRSCWYSLLGALARDGAVVSYWEYKSAPVWHDVLSWKIIRQTMAKMELFGIDIDGKAFQTVCIGLEKAILGSYELRLGAQCQSATEGGVELSRQWQEGTIILEGSSQIIQHCFRRLVGATLNFSLHDIAPLHPAEWNPNEEQGIGSSTLLPSLLEIPAPAVLHSFVRVLGLLQDYDALFSLVQWMRLYSQELEAVAGESSNGERILRRTLVALRVFVERSWKESDGLDLEWEISEPDERTSQHTIDLIREQVELVPGWGRWPSDEEVEDYIQSGRFPVEYLE
ncbi:hypothetical protein L228DRAFT_281754 [Xylona heveae TC161]|uniref:Uncharacterized protein n=1 Tax=Xylona heveae (strain CBS 132557 / TC161) TaxID=1328760 RepID=A0A165ICN5_XYLHT|nr:hypothetical protein L228DRAFT_281754 [Xylona heveae TC161]KZF24710.1 hypothetical protein L228DRAFT_281754 [Xylona heveae TC161]